MNVSAGTVFSDAGESGACSTRMAWVLRGLCLTGLSVSAYLAWTALNMVPVFGCGGGAVFDCGHVLNSKWSKVMGVPVSVPAVALYATLIAMLAFVRRDAPAALVRLLWNGLTVGAFLAGLAALWFIGLQVFVLKHICPYCAVAHTCGILLAVILLRNRFSAGVQKRLAASFSALGVGALVTIQVMTPAPQTFEIIRYDDVATDPNTEQTAVSVTEVFAAPGEVFEAPGEIFAAPGEVFEAPGTDGGPDAASVQVPDSPEDPSKAKASEPLTATLLLILPPKMLFLSDYLFQESATADSDKTSAPAASETSKNADSGVDSESKSESVKAAAPERKLISVAGNRVTLDVRQWPLLGRPDAKYIFVEMFDYTCPHCRSTHGAIKGALDQYGDDLAIVALPVPLERSCNDTASGGGHVGACELGKIAVTVWRVSPSKFREFHDWMFESVRAQNSARAHAEKLVGAAEFRKEFESKIPSDYIKRHVDLYKKVGQGSVPKLLFPKSTINGEITSKTTMCNTIERELVLAGGN